jgi:hypothetical protein
MVFLGVRRAVEKQAVKIVTYPTGGSHALQVLGSKSLNEFCCVHDRAENQGTQIFAGRPEIIAEERVVLN